jgi:integrase
MARGSVQKRVSERTGKVSWRVRWDCRKPDGTRGQCSETAGSEEEGDRLLRKRMREVDEGGYVRPARLTVREYLVDHWLPAYRPTVAPATAARQERDVRLHLVRELGERPLAKLTTPDVQAAYRRLGERLGASTVAIVHRTLRQALGQAVEAGLVGRNVAAAARPPRADPREGDVWDAGQTVAFLVGSAADQTYGPLWLMAAGSGLRRGELLGLRWRDIDLAAGVVRVARRRTKTRAGARSLRLPAPVVAELRAHRARQNARRLRAGERWQDGDCVFDRGDGRAMSPRTVDGAFARAVRRSGLPAIRLHDLRHGYVTVLARAGVGAKTISAMVGHANVGITLDLYTHLGLEDQDGAVAALEEALGGLGRGDEAGRGSRPA